MTLDWPWIALFFLFWHINIVHTYNNCPPTNTIEIYSRDLDQSPGPPDYDAVSYIRINNGVKTTETRGLTVYVIDRNTFNIEHSQSYDVHLYHGNSATNDIALRDYLMSLEGQTNKIVIVNMFDEAAGGDDTLTFLANWGCVLAPFIYRESFYFIGIPTSNSNHWASYQYCTKRKTNPPLYAQVTIDDCHSLFTNLPIYSFTSTLPRAGAQMAVSYFDNKIYLIGGAVNPKQLMIFDVFDHQITVDQGINAISHNIDGRAQYYTQVNEILYMIRDNVIATYNMKTKVFNPTLISMTISQDSPGFACLASTEEYLFIVGGYNGAYISAVQALEISSTTWVPGISNMLFARDDAACIVHPVTDELFVISGIDGTIYPIGIEKLFVGNNIQSQIWQFVNHVYAVYRRARAVAYKNYILLIGGSFETINVIGQFISVIDIFTGAVTIGGHLNTNIANPGAIIVNNDIYLFGGDTSFDDKDYDVNTIQYWPLEPVNKYIKVTSATLSWTDANTYCIDNYGTELATIYDEISAKRLFNLWANGPHMWVGLNDRSNEGVFVYPDGYDCDQYDNNGCNGYWISGQPDNFQNNEHCSHLRVALAVYPNMLNDAACGNQYNFICNAPATSCNDIYRKRIKYFAENLIGTRNLYKLQLVDAVVRDVNCVFTYVNDNEMFVGAMFESFRVPNTIQCPFIMDDSCRNDAAYGTYNYKWGVNNINDYWNNIMNPYLLVICNNDALINVNDDHLLLPFNSNFFSTHFTSTCYETKSVSIRNNKCTDTYLLYWMYNNNLQGLHTDSEANSPTACTDPKDGSPSGCSFPGSALSEDNFGFYGSVNPAFSCSASSTSTTNYFIGRVLDYIVTWAPTIAPSFSPSLAPTLAPSLFPSIAPSIAPTTPPTLAPSLAPSLSPTITPTQPPSLVPSLAPSISPTQPPTNSPTHAPSNMPSIAPSISPTIAPTHAPSNVPSIAPSIFPSIAPTEAPSIAPSTAPSITPTQPPSLAPSIAPSIAPSNIPSLAPTTPPSVAPSLAPSIVPSITPTTPPSITPSTAPTQPPSIAPSITPSIAPSLSPTSPPSNVPSFSPSLTPSFAPSFAPSIAPTTSPSLFPSVAPSIAPSSAPTTPPSLAPSIAPTDAPTRAPSRYPTLDKEYESVFMITYLIKYLENENIEILVNDMYEMDQKITEIIEQSYFEVTGLKYRFFGLYINDWLGYQVRDIDKYKYQQFVVNKQNGIRLNSRIECSKHGCNILYGEKFDKKYKNEFETVGTTKLREYFDNYIWNINVNSEGELSRTIQSELIFGIGDYSGLNILYPSETYTINKFIEDNILLIILSIIFVISFILSCLAYIYSKITHIDCIWYALMIYAIQFITFISYINVCIEII
eukprot:501423_1